MGGRGGLFNVATIAVASCVSALWLCPVCVQASCYQYLGCYVDQPWGRDLPHAIDSLKWANLTVGQCVTACRSAGFGYAALQDGTQIEQANCWCGNTYGSHGKADNSFNKCNKYCPGRPYDLCGGFNGFAGPNSIYKVQVEPELCGPGTCSGDVCQCGSVGFSGMSCQIPGICRFADSYTWGDELLTDASTQDQYVREMLTWDGKFATEGAGVVSGSFLTCDHVDLHDSGTPKSAAFYTAASKESLHISMLALVVSRTRLAWHFMSDATDESSGVASATQRLSSIISSYEKLNQAYPGLGGWLPWTKVTSAGFQLNSESNVALPALDNGQLVWSMISAAVALEAAGRADLAGRYYAHVDLMKSTVSTLFMADAGYVSMTGVVRDAKAAFSAANCERNGQLSDPYEGELMIMFMDLTQTFARQAQRGRLWEAVKSNQKAVEYSHSGLPNGPITVQRGWRFSAHELWKYLVLPYTDNPLVARVLANGERARTWNSKLLGIPGLLASCWTADHKYMDVFGIVSVSMGFTEPAESDLMVTPYAAYPLMLVDRGYGLAWHRAMLGRPEMQSVLGSVEASQAFETPPRVAKTTSWDTKVTADIAAVGGTAALTRQWMKANGLYERFTTVVEFMHAPFFPSLEGEDTPFATPPSLALTDNVPSPTPDFMNCQRLLPAVTPSLQPIITTTTKLSSTTTSGLSSTSTTISSSTTTTTKILTTTLQTSTSTTTTTTFLHAGFASGNIMLNVTAPSEAELTAVISPDSAQCNALEAAVSRSLAQSMNLDASLVSASVQAAALTSATSQALSESVEIKYTVNIEQSKKEIVADQLASKPPSTVSAFMFWALVDEGLAGYSAQVSSLTSVAAGIPCSGSGRMEATCPRTPASSRALRPEHARVLVTSLALLSAGLSLCGKLNE